MTIRWSHRSGGAAPVGALAALAAALVLMGCSPAGLAVGAGAVAATAAQEERGLDGAGQDALIRAKIAKLWLDHDPALLANVDMTVYERRVLLTGIVEDPAMQAEAVRLAWQPEEVVEVINEIQVRDGHHIGDTARDVMIAAEIKSRLLLDPEIKSINYAVDVVGRTVYVMGVAQNRKELDRVLSWARNTDYVRRVVNHVLLEDDPARVSPREEGW